MSGGNAAEQTAGVQHPASPKEKEELAQIAAVARHQLETTVRRYPYASMAAGLGVGVVLGGGIPTWVLRTAAMGLTRVAVAQAAKSLATPEDGP